MSKKNFYAVRRGANTGVYTTWDAIKPLVLGVSGAIYKGFKTRSEADAWVRGDSEGAGVPIRPAPPHVNLKTKTTLRRVAPAGCTTVFCDGACPGNGTASARAGVGIFFGHGDPRNYAGRLSSLVYRQTNQVAEIMAAVMTVRRSYVKYPLLIVTDSMYVVKSMNEWRNAWKSKKWDVPLVNLVHLRELSDLVDARPKGVFFAHVKGHGTSVGNIAADGLATAGAQMDN